MENNLERTTSDRLSQLVFRYRATGRRDLERPRRQWRYQDQQRIRKKKP